MPHHMHRLPEIGGTRVVGAEYVNAAPDATMFAPCSIVAELANQLQDFWRKLNHAIYKGFIFLVTC